MARMFDCLPMRCAFQPSATSLLQPDIALAVLDGEPPRNYLSNAAKQAYKCAVARDILSPSACRYVEHENKVLVARALTLTTIRTTDVPLARFLALYREPAGNVRHCQALCQLTSCAQAFLQAVKGVSAAASDESVLFFPVVANGLLTIVCSANEAHSMAAFRALLDVAQRVASFTVADQDTERSAFLSNWLDHVLTLPRDVTLPVRGAAVRCDVHLTTKSPTQLHEALLTNLFMFFVMNRMPGQQAVYVPQRRITLWVSHARALFAGLVVENRRRCKCCRCRGWCLT